MKQIIAALMLVLLMTLALGTTVAIAAAPFSIEITKGSPEGPVFNESPDTDERVPPEVIVNGVLVN